jgi:hypothetical protein
MEEPFEIEVTKIFNVPVSAWPPVLSSPDGRIGLYKRADHQNRSG